MGIIYKPQTRKGPVILLDYDTNVAPTITLEDGRVITAVRADRAGGTYKGDSGYQWVFDDDVLGQEGATLKVDGKTQKLDNTNMSYRGNEVGSLSESSKGAIGDTSGAGLGGSVEGGFGASQVGEFGVAPAFLGEFFPSATLTKYQPIPGALKTAQQYQYIDPIKFGKEFNPFQREELAKNFQQAGQFALQALDTEFQALSSFVPKSTALAREQIAIDNAFNQAQRTQQIQQAIPGELADLESQGDIYRTYAQGRVPDSVTDRALELGVRSAAADVAATSGFGVGSSAARKASDLMSAERRIALQLEGGDRLERNVAARTALKLAPTSYSEAGQQIGIMPSVSAAQVQTGAFGTITGQTSVSAENAFASATQQSQYITSLLTTLQQRTQEFNASNILQNDQFNATNLNEFALSFFNYLTSYANAVAGAAQTNINTGVELEQQEIARQEAKRQRDKTQKGNIIEEGLGAVGSIIGGITSLF